MIAIEVDEQVLADIGRGFSIPAKPELLLQLQDLMAETEPQLDAIADIISKDVAIAATILKTVNSPLYGLARSMADIRMSVRYIGLTGIYNLVTGCLLKQGFNEDSCSIALDDFWTTTTNIANCAVFINKHLKQPLSAEKLFTLGLFHDCGIPVMAMKYSNYQSALNFATDNPHITLPQVEEKLYQVNHATIGYYVASSWRLPKDLCQLILRHHDRHLLDELHQGEFQSMFSVLKMAENIVERHKHIRDTSDWQYLSDAVLNVLELEQDDYTDISDDVALQLI